MLELELGGKAVTTMNEKQEMKINGNVVEVERIGNSIYVNRQAINLIVVDTKNKWKSVLMLGILISAVAGVLYLAATNQELVTQGFGTVVDFVQTSAVPAIENTIDTIGGMVGESEAVDTSAGE